jgi:hypothetical protein
MFQDDDQSNTSYSDVGRRRDMQPTARTALRAYSAYTLQLGVQGCNVHSHGQGSFISPSRQQGRGLYFALRTRKEHCLARDIAEACFSITGTATRPTMQ